MNQPSANSWWTQMGQSLAIIWCSGWNRTCLIRKRKTKYNKLLRQSPAVKIAAIFSRESKITTRSIRIRALNMKRPAGLREANLSRVAVLKSPNWHQIDTRVGVGRNSLRKGRPETTWEGTISFKVASTRKTTASSQYRVCRSCPWTWTLNKALLWARTWKANAPLIRVDAWLHLKPVKWARR